MSSNTEIQIRTEKLLDSFDVKKEAQLAELTDHVKKMDSVIHSVNQDISILEKSLGKLKERQSELLEMKNSMLMGCFDAFCGRMPS